MKIFKRIGAPAGAAKCPTELRIPMKRETIPISRINGNIIRVR
jgi:hypothetical protein